MNWKDAIISYIHIAFLVQTPLDERLKRINEREKSRFGSRVLIGGDMYIQQQEFLNTVANRDIKSVEESARMLRCPIIDIDGTLSVMNNVYKIIDYLDRKPSVELE